ncbi:MAG TPA: protein kinase [Planktothrix sp.]
MGNNTSAGSGQGDYSPGAVLAGRYRIVEQIGRGGMGQVYRVTQIMLDKDFALKTVNKNALSDNSVRRFQHEAKASFSLDHPNIIAVRDFGLLEDQTPFLTMELIQGATLSDLLKAKGTLSIDDALAIFTQVCVGLGYAHEHGIVHRDIKPSNIMLVRGLPLGTEGSIKILDFGIAKFTAHEGGEIQALTRTGEIFGSPVYMSPEQCSGQQVDTRSDVYSLGCVLFEALTGAPPFVTESALHTMAAHVNQPVPTLRQASLGRAFPPALEAVVAGMLSKNAENRPGNLVELANELTAIRGGKTESTRQITSVATKTAKSTDSVSFKTLILSIVISSVLSSTVTALICNKNQVFQPPAYRTGLMDGNLLPLAVPEVDMTKGGPYEDSPQALAKRLSVPTNDGRFSFPSSDADCTVLGLIGSAHWIKELEMRNCTIANSCLSKLSNLPIVSIGLFQSKFDDEGARCLSRIPTLRKIKAEKTLITDAGVASLARMPNLQRIGIQNTSVSSRGVAQLSKCKSLLEINMDDCSNLRSQPMSTMRLEHLQVLTASGNGLTDRDLDKLVVPNLQNVFFDNNNITLDGITKFVETHPHLLYVSMAECPHIAVQDIETLKRKFNRVAFRAQKKVRELTF